jgi:hypothetical protein
MLNAPRQLLIRRRDAEQGSKMSAAERGSCRDGVAFRNLVLDGRLKIRKGGADDWLSHYRRIQSGMLFECVEVMLIERSKTRRMIALFSSIDMV